MFLLRFFLSKANGQGANFPSRKETSQRGSDLEVLLEIRQGTNDELVYSVLVVPCSLLKEHDITEQEFTYLLSPVFNDFKLFFMRGLVKGPADEQAPAGEATESVQGEINQEIKKREATLLPNDNPTTTDTATVHPVRQRDA
jgi:hypothetical protein